MASEEKLFALYALIFFFFYTCTPEGYNLKKVRFKIVILGDVSGFLTVHSYMFIGIGL